MAHILTTGNVYFSDVPGGSQRIACDLAHALAEEGHRVWYLCADSTRSKPEREIDGRVEVLRYRLPPTTLRNAPFRHRQHLEGARRVLERHLPGAPDIVLGHGLLGYVAARRVLGRVGRWCYAVHSPAVEEMQLVWQAQGRQGWVKSVFGLPTLRRLERAVLSWSDAVTAESRYTVSLLAAHHGKPLADRIRIVPGWTDSMRFHPLIMSVAAARQRLGWPPDRPVLFALRRLERRTGIDNLLHALAKLRREGRVFHAVLGGSGTWAEALRDLRDRLDLSACVQFPGRVTDEDLSLAYGACDASVIPTSHLECFGLIALEALACGRPALATPVGALPEVVGRFEPEWIAAGADPESIADLLRRFLAGRLPPYSPERHTKQLEYFSFSRALSEYRELLGLA